MTDETGVDRKSPKRATPRRKAAGAKQAMPNRLSPPSEFSNEWFAKAFRHLYDETLNEPIPESFRDLLDRLDREVKPKRRR